MHINEQLNFSGPFRLDSVHCTMAGRWIFDLKIGIREKEAPLHSGYVRMAGDSQAKGLYLEACEGLSGLQEVLDSDFDLAGIQSIPEASDRFCRRLIELGLGPAYNSKNQIVSVFTPDSFSTSTGALIGDR